MNKHIVCLAAVFALLQGCKTSEPTSHDAATGACAAPHVLRYEQPGCDVAPVCGSPAMDSCSRLRCSCAGKVIGGCDYYAERYTDATVPAGARSGDSCSTD